MSQEIIKVAKETLGESRGFGPRGKESWWWNESVQSKVRVKKECFKEWSRCRNSETWDKYKIARNETKKAVSEARAQAFDGLYQALGTRDGERSIYRLAKGRERKTRDLDQVKCVKDEEGKVLVHEKDIKERWRAYFHNLFNDGYGYDSSSLDTREEDRNYKYYRRIQKQEVKEALKRMSNGKAVGPDNIPIEVWKTLGDRGLEWLTKLFNEIMRSKRMPEEWRRSTLVPIYKNKGDIQNCANYRGIKLMSHTMKLWERVIERKLRKETQVTENQFGFMPGRSTMEAIYLLRRVMEQYRMDQQDLHLIFIDLEKAYDRVPREILWKALEKKGVRVAYIRAIQDMYDRVSTSVRTQGGESDDFPITIGLHQGSTLSPYLFTLILDVLTEQIQEIAPRCMLFADDIVLLGESREELNERLETWRRALETHGFRLSRSKSEYMECKFNKRRRVSNSEVKIGDHIIPQVTRFKYLGSVIQDDGEIEGDVNHRIQAGWMKWRKASGVLCDAKVPIKLNGKFYRTAVRPAILYGTECWAVKSQHENKVGVAEMRMLRWMCGKTRQDKIRNEAIRERVGVVPIVEKMVENRLRWFGHVERRPVDSVVRKVDQMERRQTIRGRGRPKKTIREVIKKDLELNDLDRRTVRRFLEKQKNNIIAVVFCTVSTTDTEIYKRLLPLYFPRDKHEEQVALSKLPADVGDENGETISDERKIRIKPLPKRRVSTPPEFPVDLPVSDVGLVSRNSSHLDSFLDPAFMSMIKDPDQRRMEQWEKTAEAQRGWNCAKLIGYGDLGRPTLSAAEEYSLHSRYLSKANSLNLSEIAEMKIVYRGGVDSEGHPVMVVVGAHFLLRCLDLERFVLYVVKEFEPLIQKPFSIVYFHSAASLQVQPDLGWMRRLQQILGRKHQRNLHAIYVLHPTFGLKAAVFGLQMFVDNVVWKKVVYVDRLLQLFRYVPREQLTIPDFVFQHDLEVNGGTGLIVDPRTKYVYNRP
ncbi:Ganglioside-induced differentiation-associated protein 2 [Glycine soja]|uniref:Ganglioside-induced differentiation-associated protein 2 n=1 Tax=Glycine soja TaxID=3848 RepID=A0A445F014_GLYSO|nr:Ganglioside-induced differentiation-associated protein 2 [Glycine soja]